MPTGDPTPAGVAETGSAMAHSYTNLLYHIVFSTKERRPWIGADIADKLHAYLGGGVRSEGGTALIVNGQPDHIHILARMRQDKSLSELLRGIKANSSKWIHESFPSHQAFVWQAGYSAFTVSQSQLERVRTYIANQPEHHRRRTFEEELTALLRAHGIAFDPQHVWQ
jgi:putative transposase